MQELFIPSERHGRKISPCMEKLHHPFQAAENCKILHVFLWMVDFSYNFVSGVVAHVSQ